VKTETLTVRQLNRATLARQMLLARRRATPLAALERLVGLQAQLPRPPFVALWSRLEGFRAEQLCRPVHARKAVRATLMRGTLHLVTTRDYLALRPTLQPVLDASMQSVLGARTSGVDLEAVAAVVRERLDERPRSFDELRAELRASFPGGDERALAYAIRMQLPLVQVPADARWGWPGAASFAVAESWLGRRLGEGSGPGALVLRYLAAFGPAGPQDAQAWSGLRRLADTFEALRPRLVSFRDERGRELFDLPRSPRPPAGTPAPVRFLPDFDNLLLGHDDRARFLDEAHRARMATANLRVLATFLVDGRVRGTWRVERSSSAARLVADAFEPLKRAAASELRAEGQRLVRFLEPDARSVEVRVDPG
jgi:hypothetical protein